MSNSDLPAHPLDSATEQMILAGGTKNFGGLTKREYASFAMGIAGTNDGELNLIIIRGAVLKISKDIICASIAAGDEVENEYAIDSAISLIQDVLKKTEPPKPKKLKKKAKKKAGKVVPIKKKTKK